MRVGFIAARPDWTEALVDLKLAATLGNSALAATVVHRLLTEGGYRRHLDTLRPKLSASIAASVRRLSAIGLVPWVEPRGGMFLWAGLPDGLDAVEVASEALKEDVIFAPGRAFSPNARWRGHMRFNGATSSEPRFVEALERAMKVVAKRSR